MNLTNITRIATIIVAGIVVIIGGIVTIVHPESLPFTDYVKDVATGGGLLGIGYGLDRNSKP